MSDQAEFVQISTVPCPQLIILEGPDGAGKSTLAERYAAQGFWVVHLDRFPRVKNLARLHLEAMTPALNRHRAVVLDRAWMTERVYGEVYRSGANRIPVPLARMLERVAARCPTRVLLCLPPVEACLKAFRSRRDQEYLKGEDDLRRVWERYAELHARQQLTSLPTDVVDYTDGHTRTLAPWTIPHPGGRAAGRWDAPIVLVGEGSSEHTDADPLAQYPFVQLGAGGCSRWLAAQLEEGGISEASLLWANASDPEVDKVIFARPRQAVIALGSAALKRLHELGIEAYAVVDHPQHAKRFKHRDPYPLIKHLKEVLRGHVS